MATAFGRSTMIGKIFLGRAWHWLLLIVVSGLLWFCGTQKLHVIEFNIFVMAMLAGTAVAVLIILLAHREGDQVTREVLVENDDTENQIFDRE